MIKFDGPPSEFTPAADDLGKLVTFVWNQQSWFGMVIEAYEANSAPLVLGLVKQGTKQIAKDATPLPNVRNIRPVLSTFRLRLGAERDQLWPPQLVRAEHATLLLDNEGAPWIRVEDQFYAWWANALTGHKGTDISLGNLRAGYDTWSLWRQTSDGEECVATAKPVVSAPKPDLSR